MGDRCSPCRFSLRLGNGPHTEVRSGHYRVQLYALLYGTNIGDLRRRKERFTHLATETVPGARDLLNT